MFLSGTLNGISNGSNDEIGQCDDTTGQQSYLRSNDVISNLNGEKSILLIEDTWNINRDPLIYDKCPHCDDDLPGIGSSSIEEQDIGGNKSTHNSFSTPASCCVAKTDHGVEMLRTLHLHTTTLPRTSQPTYYQDLSLISTVNLLPLDCILEISLFLSNFTTTADTNVSFSCYVQGLGQDLKFGRKGG